MPSSRRRIIVTSDLHSPAALEQWERDVVLPLAIELAVQLVDEPATDRDGRHEVTRSGHAEDNDDRRFSLPPTSGR